MCPLNIDEEKKVLRSFFKKKRKLLSEERKNQASLALIETLYPLLVDYKSIVSFASLPDEINTKELNQKLCEEKRLILPKIEGKDLNLYYIKDLQKLIQSSLRIMEPSLQEPKAKIEDIDCILVPGLGFDSCHHRLGFGSGHYDKLLSSKHKYVTIGLGFKEQLSEDLFPLFKHDIKLDHVMLF